MRSLQILKKKSNIWKAQINFLENLLTLNPETFIDASIKFLPHLFLRRTIIYTEFTAEPSSPRFRHDLYPYPSLYSLLTTYDEVIKSPNGGTIPFAITKVEWLFATRKHTQRYIPYAPTHYYSGVYICLTTDEVIVALQKPLDSIPGMTYFVNPVRVIPSSQENFNNIFNQYLLMEKTGGKND